MMRNVVGILYITFRVSGVFTIKNLRSARVVAVQTVE